jgi:two-component system response regulator FixJ
VVDCIGYPIDVARLASRFEAVLQRTAATIAARTKRAKALRRIAVLSVREREVARDVAAGLSSKEIGRHLDISPRTVEIHRSNAMNKLEAGSTTAMVRLMVEAGYDGQCAVGWLGIADGANDRAQASATAPHSARASSRAATGSGSS